MSLLRGAGFQKHADGVADGGCSFLCPAHVPVFIHGCGSLADIQDDQVVEAVSRDKKRELPLEQILALTEDTFHSALLEATRTVVLFYASCEYEIWPGSPFSKLALLTMLSVPRCSCRQVVTISRCCILPHLPPPTISNQINLVPLID